MAGFMKKLQGHVYTGQYPAGEVLQNGVFVEIVDDGAGNKVVKKLTAKGDIVMRITEKTALWRKNALVLDVVDSGAKDIYFVENELDFILPCYEYNTAEFECPVGRLVKMHRVLDGEQLITTAVDADVYAALNAEDLVVPGAGGLVIAKA